MAKTYLNFTLNKKDISTWIRVLNVRPLRHLEITSKIVLKMWMSTSKNYEEIRSHTLTIVHSLAFLLPLSLQLSMSFLIAYAFFKSIHMLHLIWYTNLRQVFSPHHVNKSIESQVILYLLLVKELMADPEEN